MSLTPSRHLVNPLLGVYFGIFASLLIGIVLMALMLEQLGLEDHLLRGLISGGLVALLAGLALATRSNAIFELLYAGRRVPAVFTGLTLAVTLLGGTMVAALPGLFYLMGFDALFLTVGMTTGLVVFAILIAPYIRKSGAYSVPAYLGLRFASPMLRVVAAAIASVPLLLLIVAELKVALMAGSWLTELSPLVLTIALSLVLVLVLVSGGMRSLSWTSAAQAIVMLLAVLIPVMIIAGLMGHLPVPRCLPTPLPSISRTGASRRPRGALRPPSRISAKVPLCCRSSPSWRAWQDSRRSSPALPRRPAFTQRGSRWPGPYA